MGRRMTGRKTVSRSQNMKPLTPPPPGIGQEAEDQHEGPRAAAAAGLASMEGVMLDIAGEVDLKQGSAVLKQEEPKQEEEPKQPELEQEPEVKQPAALEAKSAEDFLEFLKEARHSVSQQDSRLKERQDQITALIEKQSALDMQLEVTAERLSVHATPQKVKEVEDSGTPAPSPVQCLVGALFSSDDTGDTEMKVDDGTARSDAVQPSEEAPAVTAQAEESAHAKEPAHAEEPVQTDKPAQAEEPARAEEPPQAQEAAQTEDSAQIESAEPECQVPFPIPKIEEPVQTELPAQTEAAEKEAEVPFPIPQLEVSAQAELAEADGETLPDHSKVHSGAKKARRALTRQVRRRTCRTPPPTPPPAGTGALKRKRKDPTGVPPPQIVESVESSPPAEQPAKRARVRSSKRMQQPVTPPGDDPTRAAPRVVQPKSKATKAKSKPKPKKKGKKKPPASPSDDENYDSFDEADDTETEDGMFVNAVTPENDSPEYLGLLVMDTPEVLKAPVSTTKRSRKAKKPAVTAAPNRKVAEVAESYAEEEHPAPRPRSAKPQSKQGKGKVQKQKKTRKPELIAGVIDSVKSKQSRKKQKEGSTKKKSTGAAAKKKSKKQPPASPSDEEADSFDDEDMDTEDGVYDDAATPTTDSPDSLTSLVMETPEVVRTARLTIQKSKRSKASKKKKH